MSSKVFSATLNLNLIEQSFYSKQTVSEQTFVFSGKLFKNARELVTNAFSLKSTQISGVTTTSEDPREAR